MSCPNEICWEINDGKCVPKTECMATNCGSSSISGTISTDVFGLGRSMLYVNDVETDECMIQAIVVKIAYPGFRK